MPVTGIDNRQGLAEVLGRAIRQFDAYVVQARVVHDRTQVFDSRNAVIRKHISGEIESIPFGVFINIAKDIRQLQGLALGESKAITRLGVKSKHPCRQPANG